MKTIHLCLCGVIASLACVVWVDHAVGQVAIGEVGRVTTNQDSSSVWHTVNLQRTYTNPVVIMGPPSTNGIEELAIRVRNVGPQSFEFQFDEWDFLNGKHTEETVGFVVIEAGVYQLPDGALIEAGIIPAVSEQWHSQGLTAEFTGSPIVLTQCVTDNEQTAVVTRQKDITAAAFDVALQEEEASINAGAGNHSDETVAYIAMQPFSSANSFMPYEADRTGDAVGHQFAQLTYSKAYVDPVFLAAMQTSIGLNTAALRQRNPALNAIEVKVEEERSLDDEVIHVPEDVGYIVFAQPGLLFGEFIGSDQRPNIVLIMADDLGREAIQAYGGQSYQTPNIDQLATDGMRFTHCFSYPLCTPSRTALMSGRAGIRNYRTFGVLDPNERTFGHMLQAAGYRTCIAGKWQLYGWSGSHPDVVGTGMHPSNAGFDSYALWQIEHFGIVPGQIPSPDDRYWGPFMNQNGFNINFPESFYSPDYMVQFIRNFINNHEANHPDKPFFVYYPMNLPHFPFNRTPDSDDLTNNNRLEDDPVHFADMVAYVDKNVGRLVTYLEENGLRDNTIIIFLADNGTDPLVTSQFEGEEYPGGKGLPTDSGTRVPLVVSWPAGQTEEIRGTTNDDLIDFTDFLPTLAEVANTAPPDTNIIDGEEVPIIYDGRSFLPQVVGQVGNPRDHIYMLLNRNGRGDQMIIRYVRTKEWKLYDIEDSDSQHSRHGRLFHVTSDPEEQNPVNILGNADTLQTWVNLRNTLGTYPQTPQNFQWP